jgi:molybdopterin-guanine dinucleotide biosynthesis protein A
MALSEPAPVAGFVLVGGRSSRMGRDKAMMEFGESTLVEHVARLLNRVCGSVVLVGCPERYRAIPYPAIPDVRPEQGPLGGIQAALSASVREWNLIVACDMPAITLELLELLVDATRECAGDSIVAVSPDGRLQPLCAVYRRRCLGVVSGLLGRGVRRMSDAIPQLGAVLLPIRSAESFRNLNTLEDWSAYQTASRKR